jgi:RimJ/RimL family protein N-acetyltransferase
MRMCIVGNGPSAKEYAREIDTCDFVVRLNSWPPNTMGTKWSAWASSFSPWGHMQAEAIRYKLFDVMPKNLRVWCIGTPQKKWGYVSLGKGTMRFAPPGWKPKVLPCERIGVDIGRWTGNHIRSLDRSHKFSPSTGFQVLGYALTRRPDELVLVGFDAIAEGKPGWGDSWNWMFGPAASVRHNYPVQKRCIEQWLKTRTFCGKSFPKTRPLWWRLKKHVPPPEYRAIRVPTDKGASFAIEMSDNGGAWVKMGAVSGQSDGAMHITLDEEYRGKHLSAAVLRCGSRAVNGVWPKLLLKGYVDPGNAPARRCFERAGYIAYVRKGTRPLRIVTRGGKKVIEYIIERFGGSSKKKKRRRPRRYARHRTRSINHWPPITRARKRRTPKTTFGRATEVNPSRHSRSAKHAETRARAIAAQAKKRKREKR